MADVTHSREQCTASWTQGVLRACICLVVFGGSSCTFDPAGTGDARTRRTRANDSVSASSSAEDLVETTRIVADRLRSARQEQAAESAGMAGAAGRAESNPAEDRDRAAEAASAARSDAGDSATGSSGAGAAATSGGGAGALGAPVGPVTSAEEQTGGPAADSGKPPGGEDDAGDDSDAGAEPIAGAGAAGAAGSPPPMAAGAGAAGSAGAEGSAGFAGGNSAGRGDSGRGGPAGRGGSEGGAGATGGSNRDRELLLSLIDISVGVLQDDPTAQAGDLLATLAAATSADPALLARVLEFVRGTENCETRGDACERVCDLVEQRCRECTENADCREALRSTCDSSATECR